MLWAVCTGVLWSQAAVIYVFAYDDLVAFFADTSSALLQSPAPSRAQLARDSLYLVLAAAASVLVWLRKGDYATLIRSRWSAPRVAATVMASLLLIFTLQALSTAVAHALGIATADRTPWTSDLLTTRELLLAILDSYGPWTLFPLLALIVPFYEELAFRSILLGSASRHLPFAFANVLQAATLTLLHDEPIRYPALFTIGLLAGLFTRRSGGLAPAIALHATINFIAACGLCLVAAVWHPGPRVQRRVVDAADARAAAEIVPRCDHGRAASCDELAERYDEGMGVTRDEARSTEFSRRACDGGLALACARLGMRYEKGRGVAVDTQAAESLYERACSAGSLWGCHYLGLMRQYGVGGSRDAPRAATLFEDACNGGLEVACGSLGYLRVMGDGVPEDMGEAARLFERACRSGDAVGCLNLGVQYAHGHGVAQDFVKAAEIYQRACDIDSFQACTNLALLYERGQGVTRDLERAVELHRRACEHVTGRSCDALERFGKTTSEQPARTEHAAPER